MSSDQIKKRIQELKDLEAAPLPTPPVGTNVVWFPGAKRDVHRPYEDAVAALVTKIDGSGKLTLIAFAPHAMPSHKRSSHHVDHPIHLQRANSVSVDSGSWDYPQGTTPPKAHFAHHLAELGRQRAEAEANLALNDSVAAKK
jgi:hypothetical protein